jgi:hypothetical protein
MTSIFGVNVVDFNEKINFYIFFVTLVYSFVFSESEHFS